MKRYILTGAPGSGKTSIIRLLEKEKQTVIEEAATDIISSEQAKGIIAPWKDILFIDKILQIQKQRQISANALPSKLQFYDRSPVCTYALCNYLSYKPSQTLLDEMERIKREAIYKKQVFFIENIGFCVPSMARKITYEESLRFEKIHEETYASFGYECIKIASETPENRTKKILSLA